MIQGLGLATVAPTVYAKDRPNVPVGAIRWDAWYAPGSTITDAVAETLGATEYAGRIPTFGSHCSETLACFPRISQSQIDREIDMAAAAGLNFWAFVAYQKGHPMHLAFQHYLQSRSASKINFSLICSAGRFMNDQALIDDHSKLLAHPGYQKSATGFPIYSVFISSKRTGAESGMNKLKERIEGFRIMARNKSGARVEIAALLAPGTEPSSELMRAGFDAVGHYAIVCSRAGRTFRDLSNCAEAQWEKDAMAYRAIIPTVMTGWDRRPRMKKPVPWESRRTGQANSFSQPSAVEFRAHVGNALRFAGAHPTTPAILIYAWNEFDEGGWLYPTLADDFDRLASLKIALQSTSKGEKDFNHSRRTHRRK
tara:strand:- start:5260 stop:6363 length:1104 start_codon:yes stop_codon:yes gene_type:complete